MFSSFSKLIPVARRNATPHHTTMKTMTKSDLHHTLETAMLALSIQENIPLEDLFVEHKKKFSYVVQRSTGRGIYRADKNGNAAI